MTAGAAAAVQGSPRHGAPGSARSRWEETDVAACEGRMRAEQAPAPPGAVMVDTMCSQCAVVYLKELVT